MISYEELKDQIIWQTPRYVLIEEKDYFLIAELDIFNNHVEYYTVYDKHEEGHSDDIIKAIDYFYNKVYENE